MSATALIPLTCYTHPNNQQSLLKYPNVICGTDVHGAMLAIGVALLIVGVFGFLSLCSYAAYMVPTWSAREQHGRVRAFRFLVFRFRLAGLFGSICAPYGSPCSLGLPCVWPSPPSRPSTLCFSSKTWLEPQCAECSFSETHSPDGGHS